MTADGGELAEDLLSVEEPLLVRVNGAPMATLMRTPGEDVALVSGFLFAEGVIRGLADLVSIEASPVAGSHEMDVWLRAGVHVGPTAARSTYLSSSCGVCGRASVAEMLERIEPIEGLEVEVEVLLGLPEKLRAGQRQFALSGGVHAAALFDRAGELLGIEEDVGRHNALDKLVGKSLAQGLLPLRQSILVMSSRASFDILQKAAMAGIPVVATMGAASSLAAELAAEAGVQLFCFLKAGRVVRLDGSGVRSNA